MGILRCTCTHNVTQQCKAKSYNISDSSTSLVSTLLLPQCFEDAFLCSWAQAVAALCWDQFTFVLQSRHHARSGFDPPMCYVVTATIIINFVENLSTESAFLVKQATLTNAVVTVQSKVLQHKTIMICHNSRLHHLSYNIKIYEPAFEKQDNQRFSIEFDIATTFACNGHDSDISAHLQWEATVASTPAAKIHIHGVYTSFRHFICLIVS